MIDAISITKIKMDSRRIPLRTIADITGVPQSEISRMFTGAAVVAHSNERSLTIATAVAQLERLAVMVDPIPVDFRAGQRLRQILSQIEDGTLRVTISNDNVR